MTVTFYVMTLTFEPLTRYCIVIFLSPCSIFVWNLYIKAYLSYRVRTKALTKLSLWHWPLNHKKYRYLHLVNLHLCINMKALPWKLLNLSCQKQSADKVNLWPWLWPFDPKLFRYLPLTILHLCTKYESFSLKTSQVILSEPKCWQNSVVTFDILTPKCLGTMSILHPCMKYETVCWKLLKLSCQNQSFS